MPKKSKHLTVGYADFVRLTRFWSSEHLPGVDLRPEGIFVIPPPVVERMTPEERATLSEHPTGNLSAPALLFPCALAELQTFLQDSGFYGCIDPFDAAYWAAEKVASVGDPRLGQAVSERSETTYLNIIGGLLGLMLEKTPARNSQTVYHSQAAIIDALLVAHPGKAGIAESTLKARFAEANRSLDQS